MSMNPNALLSEQAKLVVGLASVVPSAAVPAWVSMKGYNKATIVILGVNATTVTGSAIALKQAQAVAGTGIKVLPFTTARRNIDTATLDALADFAVTANTFTLDSTNSKNLMYEITVDESTLDTANNFDCIRLDTGNATAQTLTVLYILWPAKYGRSTPPSVIAD